MSQVLPSQQHPAVLFRGAMELWPCSGDLSDILAICPLSVSPPGLCSMRFCTGFCLCIVGRCFHVCASVQAAMAQANVPVQQ